MPDQLSALSHDYVFNYIFKKLSDTIAKYRSIIPVIDELENAVNSVFWKHANLSKDEPFEITVAVLDVLKVYSLRSPLVTEIFENVRRDFWHQLKPGQVAKHEGKYYIDSVTD